MNQEQHDNQLNVLLADLFASDERDLDLLVRYAANEASLSTAERASVESRLNEDPSWQDRLRVLRNFDPAAAFEDEEDIATVVSDREPSDEIAPVIELDRYRGNRLATWAAVAAAAAFVVWLTLPSTRMTSIPAESSGVVSVPVDDVAPSSMASTNATPEENPTREAPAPAAQVVALDDVKVEANPIDQVPVHVPVQEEEASQLAATTDPVVSAPEPVLVRDENEQAAPVVPAYDGNSEVQLAMLSSIAYEAPADRAMRAFLGDDMRGDASAVMLEAWVPDHVAQSATSHPELYWSMEGSLPEAHQLGFVITSETETEPLYEGTLAVPAQSGRQIVDLEQLGVELAEDAIYRWTIFARAPSADPSEDRITQGWVQFRTLPSTLSKDLLATSQAERAKRYAEQGYWYDALSLLVGLTEQQPGDTNVRDALNVFLASAGVERVESIQ